MSNYRLGGKDEIPQVEIECQADEFENAIRKIGVEFACEWFGSNEINGFLEKTISCLCERSGIESPYITNSDGEWVFKLNKDVER